MSATTDALPSIVVSRWCQWSFGRGTYELLRVEYNERTSVEAQSLERSNASSAGSIINTSEFRFSIGTGRAAHGCRLSRASIGYKVVMLWGAAFQNGLYDSR